MLQDQNSVKILTSLTQAIERNTETLRRVEKQLSADIFFEDKNISVKEFMKQFEVSRSSIERHKKKLGFYKFNGRLYIKQSRVDELIRNGGFDFN